jgi:hypothetical protein
MVRKYIFIREKRQIEFWECFLHHILCLYHLAKSQSYHVCNTIDLNSKDIDGICFNPITPLLRSDGLNFNPEFLFFFISTLHGFHLLNCFLSTLTNAIMNLIGITLSISNAQSSWKPNSKFWLGLLVLE